MRLKNIFSIFILVLLFCQNINAQSFVDEGNQWSLVSYNFAGEAFNTTYRIEGDTIIDGSNYKRMLVLYGNPALVVSWDESKYVREDSTKKVYCLNASNEEEVIYDFGLSVGDTIPSYDSSEFNGIVSEIDMIELNDGTMRKRLALSSLYCPDWGIMEYWIDGIGGKNLALTYIESFCVFDVGIYLRCFSNNGDFLYGSQDGSQCYIINSTEEIKESTIKIFPNPTQDILNLEYDKTIKIEQLKIFDLQGQMMRTLQVENDSPSISISNFPKGVYYLKIETAKSKFIFKKLIKM